jgi:hypothetical protein
MSIEGDLQFDKLWPPVSLSVEQNFHLLTIELDLHMVMITCPVYTHLAMRFSYLIIIQTRYGSGRRFCRVQTLTLYHIIIDTNEMAHAYKDIYHAKLQAGSGARFVAGYFIALLVFWIG